MDKTATLGTGIVIGLALLGAGALAAYDLDNSQPPSNSVVTTSTSTQSTPTTEIPSATSTTVTTNIGGEAEGLTITVQPKELISDSRCPQNVQCVWAGTVEVRTVLASQTGHGEHTLTLGKPQTFGDYSVTLTSVTPTVKTAGVAIPASSYLFTFEIQKN